MKRWCIYRNSDLSGGDGASTCIVRIVLDMRQHKRIARISETPHYAKVCMWICITADFVRQFAVDGAPDELGRVLPDDIVIHLVYCSEPL